MTRTLYYEDTYRKECDALVTSVDGDRVVLDQTVCYPEKGGQPGDKGWINSCRIIDTQWDGEGTICHRVENPSFHAGEKVRVTLDWDHRYYFMKVHTAQHMVSGILFNRFRIGTLAVHDGEDVMTVETDQEAIGESVCEELEDAVNQAIREGHPVHYEVLSRAEAEARHLRRPIKVHQETGIRLVVVEGVDTIACGGIHVANTREIGSFVYAGQEKMRGHVRLIFHVGPAADREIRFNRSLVRQLCALHSATSDTLLAVEKSEKEKEHALKAETAKLRKALAREAWQRIPAGVVTLDITGQPYALSDLAETMEGDEDRALCAVQKREEGLGWLMIFTGSWRSFDFISHRSALLASSQGKGGGRPPVYQGMAKGEADVLFSAFRAVLS